MDDCRDCFDLGAEVCRDCAQAIRESEEHGADVGGLVVEQLLP
jgi:hypothetical protein